MEKKTWVDVNNDELMTSLGLRPPHQQPKDPSVWVKTKQEKKALRKVRRKHPMHMHSVPYKHIPVQDKIVIQLKKNKQFPYTTYSTICYMSQIDSILNFYGTNNVAHYSFNGKTYMPSERPYWAF